MLKYRRSIRAYQTIKTKKANRKVFYFFLSQIFFLKQARVSRVLVCISSPFQTILRYTPTTNKLVNIEDKPRAHWISVHVYREILKVLGQ